MAASDIRKFVVYSIFLGILILPMVGLKTTMFDAPRAFTVWGVLSGLMGLFLLLKNLRRSESFKQISQGPARWRHNLATKAAAIPTFYFLGVLIAAVAVYPWLANNYMIDVGITCLIYVMLGLGLNIVVGLAGLLDLGYIAFYAVGAYTYSLLNLHFGLGFWSCLPIGVVLGAVAGCIIGYPTLKMRGDYLAIVTLGFGEIIRLVLNNWDKLTKGPNGLMGMAKPALMYPALADGGLTWSTFALKSLHSLYYLVFILTILTVIGVNRLDKSRIGRAWVAIREDETAAELTGVPTTRLKLLAYAMGAAFASVGGAFFAAKLSYTNPNFFIFMESCIVLSIVVLGGVGSIPGIVLAAIVFISVPEFFRELQEYRMLAFGGAMTAMMVLKPEGLIPATRRKRELHESDESETGG